MASANYVTTLGTIYSKLWLTHSLTYHILTQQMELSVYLLKFRGLGTSLSVSSYAPIIPFRVGPDLGLGVKVCGPDTN